MNQFLNFPNILSFLRIFLAIPIIYFLDKNETSFAIFTIFVAVITDYFDGYFSRVNKEVTDLGKILDPLADKICVISLVLFLAITKRIDTSYFIIVFMRDIIIMIGGLHIKFKKKIIITSNWEGKVTVFFTALYILLIVSNFQNDNIFIKIIYYTNILFLFYSFYLYVKNYFKLILS